MSCSSLTQKSSPETCRRLQNIYQAVAKQESSENIQNEIKQLPIDVKQKIFCHVSNLNGQPSEDTFKEVHVVDNPQILQQSIIKVAGELFPQVDFSEELSLYQRLLNIYEAAEKNELSEMTRWELILLPNEVAQKIFSHINYFNDFPDEDSFGEIHVLEYRKLLQEAITRIANNAFHKLDADQKSSLYSFSWRCYQIETPRLLKDLNEIKELLTHCDNFPKLIDILKDNSQLLKHLPFFISNLEIQDETALIDIAKLCAQQCPEITATFIQKFDIKNEAARIDIAKLCAQKSTEATAQKIQNFDIKNEAARIDIATFCAGQNSWKTAENIKKFDIQNEAARIELAKYCACKSGWGTAKLIKNFGIQNELALIEIAKLCAHENVQGTAECMQQFGIKNEAALIEIAKLCASKSGWGTAPRIQNFGIQNETALIEIAMLCARENGTFTARYIQNFGIKNEIALIEIAKLCACQDGWETSQNIQNFGIKMQAALIEIAMLCAEENGKETAQHIKNFNIQDLNALQMVLSFCAISSPDSMNALLQHNHRKADSMKTIFRDLLDPLSPSNYRIPKNPSLDELKDFISKNIKEYICEHLGDHGDFLKQAEELKEIKDLYALQQASKWIASMLFFLAFLNQGQQNWIGKTESLKNLLSIRSPVLRQNLSKVLLKLAYQQNGLQTYSQLLNSKRSEKKQPASKESKLVDLILASLQISGVDASATTLFKSTFFPIFKGHIEIRPLLETLYFLDKSPLLSSTDKQLVLQQLCEEPKHLQKQTLFKLQTIILFNEEERLKGNSSIQNLATTIFQEKFQANITGENFERFQQLFMTDRNPTALINYAAKLFSLNDVDIMNDLRRYVNSVIHGAFLQERYQLDNNPHLQKLAEYNSDLLEKWQTPLNRVRLAFSAEKKALFNPQSWLEEKKAHHHMEGIDLPSLDALLEGKEYEASSLSDIEKALKNLLKAKDKAEQITALEEIDQEMQKLANCAFRDDVKAQLGLLKKDVCNRSQEAFVVDSDDYQDLLLCGTEVVGSCQNVNGQPRLNKGLLGYILDGKNRLIAVKDAQGRILARAKLSILWDGEKPALYLEQLYTQGQFEEQSRTAIIEMALKKAQALNLPLITQINSPYCDVRPSFPFEKDLESLGSGVSYEYVDACRNVQKKGMYQIDKAQITAIM